MSHVECGFHIYCGSLPCQINCTKTSLKALEHRRIYWSLHPTHHTAIFSKDPPLPKYPPTLCVWLWHDMKTMIHPSLCVCFPKGNRFQLSFFPPLQRLFDTVPSHPYPWHDRKIYDENYDVTIMENVSTSLWYVLARKESQETKEVEQEDMFWKVEDDLSGRQWKDQTVGERHRFPGGIGAFDQRSTF